jgi:LPXTG-site transpeptidase (sortase) family protein
MNLPGNKMRPERRRVDPLTAIGVLLFMVAATALITYEALIIPGRIRASQGPPEAFLLAATRQALATNTLPEPIGTISRTDQTATAAAVTSTPVPTVTPSGDSAVASDGIDDEEVVTGGGSSARGSPFGGSDNRYGEWPLPDYVEIRYWLSIGVINLEAPIIALTPVQREVAGTTVFRLPVPNSYSVAWDARSSQPGFAGNTILTGHNNFYGGVFQSLDDLGYGAEIAVWSEFGVFTYRVSAIEYVIEDDQPLDIRLQNAQWLNSSTDDRLTLITCWPHDTSSHRLIIVARR